jgi:Tetratricopeptide repeat
LPPTAERDSRAAARCRRSTTWGRTALAGAALAAAGALAPGDDSTWRDIESRIEYGYFTEDVTQLRNLAEQLASGKLPGKPRDYYAGLLDWRLALLATQGAAPGLSAATLARRCVSELDAALEAQPESADALALRAACLLTPPESAATHHARQDLDKALRLGATNPRVLLIDARRDYALPPAAGGNKERALTKLRRAVAVFESERSGVEPLPGWGAADAWLLLAQDLLEHGDPVGARDALERALLIAPPFAQARRLMAKITSG